jgi:5,10-methylenetetrahydromethanopterin reductase
VKYSIVLTPTVDAHQVVARAERLGFDRAWFFDSPMLYADIFVSMALAAHRTERIELGTGVVVPANRIPPVTANAIASLNALAPGRVILGLGTGFTGRNTMGHGPMRLADLDHQMEVIRELLGGRDVLWRGEEGERRVRLLHTGDRFGATRPPVPIWLSGMGRRSMELTARKADGWMAFAPGAEHGTQYLHGILAACARAGRDPDSLPRAIMSTGCVLDEGEPADSERGMANGGPLAAVFFHNLVEGSLDFELPPELAEAVARLEKIYSGYQPADARYLELHRGHLVRVRDEERPFITDELIRMSSFTGTTAQLRGELDQLEAAGCDEFGIQLMAGHEHEIERWAELFGLR